MVDYDPSIIEEYKKQEVVDGEPAILYIVDTAGQEEYKSLRAEYYQKAEAVVAVYSIADRTSFQELEMLRSDVLHERGEGHVPIVLVGNKCDMAAADRRVFAKEGAALAAAWSAEGKVVVPFLESSAKDNINITEVFHEVVRQVRDKRSGVVRTPAQPAQPVQPPKENDVSPDPQHPPGGLKTSEVDVVVPGKEEGAAQPQPPVKPSRPCKCKKIVKGRCVKCKKKTAPQPWWERCSVM